MPEDKARVRPEIRVCPECFCLTLCYRVELIANLETRRCGNCLVEIAIDLWKLARSKDSFEIFNKRIEKEKEALCVAQTIEENSRTQTDSIQETKPRRSQKATRGEAQEKDCRDQLELFDQAQSQTNEAANGEGFGER